MDKELQKEYNNLYAAFKEMEGSKLVLIEKSVSRFLKVIAKSEGLYNLIAESVLGFNYEKELNAILKNEEFTLPSSNEKIIPLVFCILNDIDNGKISAISFITSTFMDSSEEGYKTFIKKIVKPFVESIKSVLGAEDVSIKKDENIEAKEERLEIENLFTSDLVSRMNYILGEVDNKLKSLKKANSTHIREASTITYSVGLCLLEKEYLGVFGLFLGLKVALEKLKKFKNEIKEIDLLLKVLFEMK